MPQLAIIADDLTGAADTGSCFAAAGLTTIVALASDFLPDAEVIVFSTESRDLGATAAAEAVTNAMRHLIGQAGGAAPRWLYKKIDSALRGHPSDELLAMMAAAGMDRALAAPAFPAERRTTIEGRQCLDGQPIAAHRFGEPAANPDLGDLFGNDRGVPVSLLDLATVRAGSRTIQGAITGFGPGIAIADAETDADLAAIAWAASALPPRVLCGAAGFASQLAAILPLDRAAKVPAETELNPGPVLIVAGSTHSATVHQIVALAAIGVPIVQLSQAMVDTHEAALDAVISEVASQLSAGHSVVVTTAGLTRSRLGQRAVAAKLAAIAAAPDVRDLAGGLVLTGGDVATAVCAALGATAIRLHGDVAPGVPWGVTIGGVRSGLAVATKAGSFGVATALVAAVDHLVNLATGTGQESLTR